MLLVFSRRPVPARRPAPGPGLAKPIRLRPGPARGSAGLADHRVGRRHRLSRGRTFAGDPLPIGEPGRGPTTQMAHVGAGHIEHRAWGRLLCVGADEWTAGRTGLDGLRGRSGGGAGRDRHRDPALPLCTTSIGSSAATIAYALRHGLLVATYAAVILAPHRSARDHPRRRHGLRRRLHARRRCTVPARSTARPAIGRPTFRSRALSTPTGRPPRSPSGCATRSTSRRSPPISRHGPTRPSSRCRLGSGFARPGDDPRCAWRRRVRSRPARGRARRRRRDLAPDRRPCPGRPPSPFGFGDLGACSASVPGVASRSVGALLVVAPAGQRRRLVHGAHRRRVRAGVRLAAAVTFSRRGRAGGRPVELRLRAG